MQALVCGTVSWEHEFASLLFSVDGLRHPLLRHVPVARPSEDVDFAISQIKLERGRLGILECKMALALLWRATAC